MLYRLCASPGSFSLELSFFMNVEIAHVNFGVRKFHTFVLVFVCGFFILKIGRIKPVRCMKMGAVRGSCRNKWIVIGTRITLLNWN